MSTDPHSSTPLSHRLATRLWRPLLTVVVAACLPAAEGSVPDSAAAHELLKRYCYECHGFDDETREADLNIAFFADQDLWHTQPELLEDIHWYTDPTGDGSMPPEKAPQPSDAERAQLLAWAEHTLEALQNADPNDPGVVPMARLTHADYDRVIRDLTGAEISAAALLPRDSVGGEGFTSASANQMVTPELAEKWIEVARYVLRHARVSPNRGIIWHDATVPAVTDVDSARAAYQGEWVNWHDEVEAHWAGDVVDALEQRELPGVPAAKGWKERNERSKMRPFAWYLLAAWRYQHRMALGLPDVALPEFAASHDPQLVPTGLERLWHWLHGDAFEREEHRALAEAWRALPGPESPDAVPARCLEIAERFAEDKKAKRKSGLPSMKRSRSDFSGNQYEPFAPMEIFDLRLLVDQDRITEESKSDKPDPDEINRLSAELIRTNARYDQVQWTAFQGLIADIRQAHDPDLAAETPIAEALVVDFAERAWRGALVPAERDGLMALYRNARAEDRSFESAAKEALTAVLVSPRFLYRLEQAGGETGEPYAVDQRDLAERLSFVIWGSIPDGELADLAMHGKLDDDQTLLDQVHRMVADERSLALGELFGAQWLQFADMKELAQPDPDRFGDFTDPVKVAMYEESARFIGHLFTDNRPLTELITADYTFANDPLAVYYGLMENKGRGMRGDNWERRKLPDYRSGILTQGTTLVLHAQPLRTSPVQRGAWLVSHVLGTPPPEPPADVPEISDDDVNAEGLSVREQLAEHRNNPACKSCHEKIDPFGIALEHFDPAGRWRDVDGADQPIEDDAVAPDGTRIDGIADLRAWLLQDKQRDLMVRQFCKKLLGYCIGRAVRVTDGPLLDEMYAAMQTADWRVMPALETVVLSKQFRFRRDELAQASHP